MPLCKHGRNALKDCIGESIYTHDDAGDVTVDKGRTFTYGATGALAQAVINGRDFRFLYTSDEERVAAVERVAGSDGMIRNRTTYTLRGFENQLLSVWTSNPFTGAISWKEDEIWRGSTLAARNTPAGAFHFAIDHLGSPRAITDSSNFLIGIQSFAPFGTSGTSDGGALQFTAQERDAANIGDGVVVLPDFAGLFPRAILRPDLGPLLIG